MPPAPDIDDVDLEAFLGHARRAARTLDPSLRDAWLPLYESGLRAAFGQQDRRGFADMALFAAVRLDADGRHDEAISQLDMGLSLLGDSNSAAALLGSMLALYRALGHQPDAARQLVAEVELLSHNARPRRVRMESAVNIAIARCVLLDATEDPRALLQLTRRVQRSPFDWQLSGLLSWLVPLTVARGDAVGSSPWLRALGALATSSAHPWRQADAAVFRLAIEHRDEGSAAPIDAGRNYLAGWRAALLRLHRAVRHRDQAEAQEALQGLEGLRTSVHGGFTDGFAVAEAVADTRHPTDGGAALAPPATISLLNLELVLAGSEYVAFHGDQASAAAWLARLASALPRAVRTSLAWPVARDRVEGLLKVRTGDVRGGVASLRAAVQWCDAAGYLIEGALSRLQLGEILALSERPSSAHQSGGLRSAGIEVLQRHGLDPTAPAYAATRAFSLGRGASAALLAPREVQVLKLLADGMTYREAADALGVQWRTVQTHAYHAYSKLGVTRRLAAVETARRLGVI